MPPNLTAAAAATAAAVATVIGSCKWMVLDIAALRGPNNELVVKELAYEDHRSTTGGGIGCGTLIFSPPCPSELLPAQICNTNRWITTNLHGIRWDDGFVEYEKLREILLWIIADHRVIYVKGFEKAQFLTEFIGLGKLFVDLHLIGCPKASDLLSSRFTGLFSCTTHRHNPKNCPFTKCGVYADWLAGRKTRNPFLINRAIVDMNNH